MRKFVLLFLILVVIAFGMSFSLLNAAPVVLDVFLGQVELPLSVLVVGSMIAGAVLALVLAMLAGLRHRRELGRLRRLLRDTENEVRELRRLPLKDHA